MSAREVKVRVDGGPTPTRAQVQRFAAAAARLADALLQHHATPVVVTDLGKRIPCDDCHAYLVSRWAVIKPQLGRTAAAQGRDRREVLERFMAGVHARHLAGASLEATR